MKTSELILTLNDLIDEHGDLQVTVYADHGQSNELAACVGMQYIDDDGEVYAEEDIEEFDNLQKVIEIAG